MKLRKTDLCAIFSNSIVITKLLYKVYIQIKCIYNPEVTRSLLEFNSNVPDDFYG